MILYNVTVNIDEDVHEEWVEWMTKVHIPDVMATGMFVENKMCKIHAFEEGGKSYSIQYFARTQADLEKYYEEFAPKLQEDHTKRYEGKFSAFRTVLEVIYENKFESGE